MTRGTMLAGATRFSRRWVPITVAAGFPVAVGVFRGLALPMDHDAAWLLYLSGSVLDGGRLYVDLIEVNPPLVVWLGVPAILLERLLGVPHTLVFPVLVALGAFGSLLGCWRLSGGLLDDSYRIPLLCALATALFAMPAGNWGQREHLAIILTMPYILAGAVRARGNDLSVRAAWAIGLAAGVGFSIKPHFLLVPLAMEAWLIIWRRSTFRIGVILAATVAAYGVAVLVFARDYVTLMADLGLVYGRFGNPPLLQIALQWPAVLVALALPLALVRGPGHHLRMAFGIATSAWWLVTMVQGKGFHYHLLPGLGMAVILLCLALIALGSRRDNAFLAVLAPLMVTQVVAVGAVLQPRGAPEPWERIAEVEEVAADRPVLVLSHDLRDIWPAVNMSRAVWTLSLPSTWPARPDVGAAEFAAHHVALALAQTPVVLVTRRPDADPLDALLDHPLFRDAWTDYVRSDSLRHYQVYRHRARESTP